MRPVDKGKAPSVIFKRYQDAEPYLEERTGPYCMFCEMNIEHVPEVEHREAKSKGGEQLAWDNLLLACKYCNTRKSTKVKPKDADKYLWPDVDDTFHAYSYIEDIPQLNEEYLETASAEVRHKAESLYQLVNLGNIPIKVSDKDRRYRNRSEARICAKDSLNGLKQMKEDSDKERYLDLIVKLAKARGFFSVWMEVFKDDEEVLERLMEAFEGTRKDFCRKSSTYVNR